MSANYRTERLAEDDVVSFSKGREEPDWLTRLRLTAGGPMKSCRCSIWSGRR